MLHQLQSLVDTELVLLLPDTSNNNDSNTTLQTEVSTTTTTTSSNEDRNSSNNNIHFNSTALNRTTTVSSNNNNKNTNNTAHMVQVHDKLQRLRDEMDSITESTHQQVETLRHCVSNPGSNYYWIIFIVIYGAIFLMEKE